MKKKITGETGEKERATESKRGWQEFDGADWLFSALLQSGLTPNTIPRSEMETHWDPLGVSILKHTHLGESELMRPA